MVEPTQTQPTTSAPAPGNPSAPAPAVPPVASQPSTPTDAVERPAYVPESFWDADKKAPKIEEMAGKLKELTDAGAAEEQRRAALPKAAGDYKVELPADFKMPEGVQINLEDPAWPKFAEYAHAAGLSQEQFAKGAQIVTEMQLAQHAKFQQSVADFKAAEEAKLGENSKARVEATGRLLEAFAATPEKAAAARQSLGNAEIVEVIENMGKLLSSNGITAFNGNGRGDDGKRTDGKPQNWDQMSAVDRLTWSRQNPQSNGAGR